LLKLLAPVHAAAEQSPLARELVESKAVFQPQSWTAQQAYRFLTDIPFFEQCGLVVRVPAWRQNRRGNRPQVSVKLRETASGKVGLAGVLECNLGLVLGGAPLPPADLAELRQTGSGLAFVNGQWVELDREKPEAALA